MKESCSSTNFNYLLISYTKWNNFKQVRSRCLASEYSIAYGLGQLIWDEQRFENGSLTLLMTLLTTEILNLIACEFLSSLFMRKDLPSDSRKGFVVEAPIAIEGGGLLVSWTVFA